MNRRTIPVAVGLLALAASAGAVDFGVRVGNRSTDLWPSLVYFDPVQCCGLDLMAEVPIGGPIRAAVRAGVFGSAARGEPVEFLDDRLEDVLGLDARVTFLSVAPVLIEAVVGYAGLGVGYTRFTQWLAHSPESANQLTEQRVSVTVPVGFRYEMSRHFSAGAEMETPVVGWFQDDANFGGTSKFTFKGWRFASYTPSFSATVLFTPR